MNENYERTFGRFHNGLPTLIESGEMPNTHGASGMVIKVQLPTIVVLGPDQVEQTLLTNDHTLVKHFRSDASLTDIHENDFIVAVGSPNDHAQIETRFIRILPPPPAGILHSPLQSTTTPLTTSPHNNSI
jgi:hypothetical protein